MWLTGDKNKVAKVKKFAENQGLNPLYYEEILRPEIFRATLKTTPKMQKKIDYAVEEMIKKYNELKRPVKPLEITGKASNSLETINISYYLQLAYFKGIISRDIVPRGKKPSYLYRPKISS